MKLVLLVIILFISIFITNHAFGEVTYKVLENRFHNQPIACIYEPNVPEAREVIKDAWVKETELGIKNWEYELSSHATYRPDKWTIHIQKIPLENQVFFDNKDCDVEVRFTNKQIDYQNIAAGWHWFDGTRSQIELMYMDLEVCNVRTEGIYIIYEWCYKDDFVRSKALGNVATHEFGHAIGLNHFLSNDLQENYDWSIDPYSSPSVMTIAVHYDEDKNKIRKVDIDKVIEIYGPNGFGKPKETTTTIPILEDKKIGGFDAFYVEQSQYLKERYNVKYATISGIVSEQTYSRGQNVLLTVVFPDGHDEELKTLATKNRQFSIQMKIDETSQVGTYSVDAKYMGYDSETITFTIVDEFTNTAQPKEQEKSSIPSWIRSNAKWWGSGAIEDRDFVMGIQYLVQEKIIIVENTIQSSENSTQEIPDWIRSNAKWWGDNLITDSDFVKGIQYLVQQGIIKIN